MSVYFAQAGRYTKIGYSANPIGRASTITLTGKRPDDLPKGSDVRLLGWVPGNQWTEGEVQARFVERRVAGEWFAGLDVDELRDLIWSDPRGVDIQRMSAWAVFAAIEHPDKTRDELAADGVPIEAVPLLAPHPDLPTCPMCAAREQALSPSFQRITVGNIKWTWVA